MAPAKPNAFWVKKWLKDHDIDALLADAVNQTVQQRSNDPAATLSFFFQKRSKRNGELKKIRARTIYDPFLNPVLEISLRCVFNGSDRLAATVVSPVPAPPPPVLAEGEEPPESETPQTREAAAFAAAAELINGELARVLVGQHTAKTLDVDDKIALACITVPGAPQYVVSMSVAAAAASMAGMPLHAFVARYNKEMVETSAENIGGGVAVRLGDEEETPKGEGSIDKTKSSATQASEASAVKPAGPPPELSIRLPTPIFPGLSAGPGVGGAAVRMRGFGLVGKRDRPYRESLPQLVKVHAKMGVMLKERFPDAPSDVLRPDGSYVSKFASLDEVMGFIKEAVEACELQLEQDITVILDMAATTFFKPNTGEVGSYVYQPDEETSIEADGWPEWIDGLLGRHPAISAIVDPVAKDDYETWRKLRQLLGGGSGSGEKSICLFGDDLFGDNLDTIRAGVAEGWAAGAMLRPEKIGTLTNVTDAVSLFTALRPAASRVIMHHRVGVEAGAVDADIAVGLGAWGLVCGAPGPLMAGKMNQLIKAEEEVAEMVAGGKCELVTWAEVYERENSAMQHVADLASTAAKGP